MKKTLLIFIALFTVIVFTGSTRSQDDMMKKWMDYMTPGDMQKMLTKGVGSWKVKTTFWMAPGGEPTLSDATANSEMVMGGRYLQTKITGNMMGMPFEGMSLEGYDNAAKVFMSTWVDNMGTGIMYMTGKWDESAKQITYTGKTIDPMTSNWIDVRQVVTYNSDGTTKMEMYGPGPDGKEFKSMEIISTKQ
ncbi:MAG: DUF1579 domain-containing protein [Ignavibacteria bacterium]